MAEPARIWAILPVKAFRSAKKRMVPLLSPREREVLARTMFLDVLTAIRRASSLAGVVVVTDDHEVAHLAMRAGARILRECIAGGENAAVRVAVRELCREPGAGMVVLPADIPQITPDAIEALVRACQAPGSLVLVRATRDNGTNIFGCSPPDLIATSFGTGSFARHLTAAAIAGVEPRVLTVGGLGIDLDCPEDLATFSSLQSKTRTRWLLEELGVWGRQAQLEKDGSSAVPFLPARFHP